jgi:glycosyltransferase involved in cell wall biosynthesis
VAPLVTVITATYNCAELLKLSLSSLLAQSFSDFEAWVIGDACTDHTETVFEDLNDSRLRWASLARNSGSQAAPNNEGLRRARGTFVAYLGHDDLWFPWHLAQLVDVIESLGVGFVHALGAILDRDGPMAAAGPPPIDSDYRRHFTPPSTWLHRRVVIDRCGPWRDPTSLGWGVDFDFSRRAALDGARFGFGPRLGVLKFPTSNFRTYAGLQDPPQAAYLLTMQRDAVALERDVLSKLAEVLARHPQETLTRVATDRQLLQRAIRVYLRRRLLDPRLDAAWLARPLRWWFQRRRYQVRGSRGLPS